MPSLARTQRVFSDIDYTGNFLNEPIKLGNIYERDDNSFILLANICDFVPTLDLTKVVECGRKQNLSYSKESCVEVKFSASGDVKLYKGEVELNFKRKNSAFIALKDTTISQLRLSLVKPYLDKIWKENGYKQNGRHIFINQIVEASSGTVIFSQEGNNRVVLKTVNSEDISSVSKLSNGNLEFVINTKATLEIISPTPILPIFKSAYIKKNGNIELT